MMKKISIISIFILMFDQIIKIIVEKMLSYKVIIPNVLYLSYEKNYGVAFSMLWNNRIIILIISVIIISILFYYLKKEYLGMNKNDKYQNIIYGLLFGGIFGNLIDRIVRGYVVDYIGVYIFNYSFPVFNLADISITFGVILMIFLTIKQEKNN